MTPVLIVIALELGMAIGAAGAWLLSKRSNNISTAQPTIEDPEPATWLDQVIARRLVVHTHDDRSIEGLLAFVGVDGVVLRNAKLLGDRPVDLGGETWVPRADILMVQLVPEASVVALGQSAPLAVAVP